ncbi:MAG: copper-binding protein [Pseudomonadota bacterium]
MSNQINAFLLALGLSLALPVLADDMGGMSNKGMKPAAAKTAAAHGTGVVTAIDAAAGTVKLSHQPIPELRWPAMTMGFKVARPELLRGLVVGTKVRFDLQGSGMNQVITAISVSK